MKPNHKLGFAPGTSPASGRARTPRVQHHGCVVPRGRSFLLAGGQTAHVRVFGRLSSSSSSSSTASGDVGIVGGR